MTFYSPRPLAYMGEPDATTTVEGVMQFATVAETTAGTASNLAVTPLGLAAVAIAGAPAASTTQAGIIEIATNGEAAAQAASNLAIVPSNLPSIFAAPGAIGGSTPAAGNFTTLTMTDLVLTNPLGVAEGGTNIASYTIGDTLYASGATTLTKLGIGTARQLLQTNAGATAPQWASNIDVPGTLDVTGAATLDDTLAVAGAVTTGALTASGLITGSLGITVTGAAINLGSDAGAHAVNIGTGAAAKTITIGNSTGATAISLNAGTGALNIGTNAIAHTVTIGNVTGATAVAVNAGTGGIALASTGAGDITANSSDTLLLDAAGVLELNSSAGAISIGNDAVAQAINVGTGAAARVITIGNVTGASQVVLNSGTAGVAINTTGTGPVQVTSADEVLIDAAGVLELNSSAGVISIGNDAVAQNINIGTGAAARTIAIGNATGATAVNITSGTGNVALASTTSGDITLASADTVLIDGAGVVEINSSGGVISIGNDAVAQNINVGTGAAARTVTIGNATGATAITVNAGTGAVALASNATDHATSVGSATGASATTINGGTSGITLNSGVLCKVTSVATAASPYSVLGTDYFITTNSTGGALTITLPGTPVTGRTIVVYDGVGQGAANNVTIDGNGNNIAAGGTSAATKLINTAYESYILTYNGTLWCGQNIV